MTVILRPQGYIRTANSVIYNTVVLGSPTVLYGSALAGLLEDTGGLNAYVMQCVLDATPRARSAERD